MPSGQTEFKSNFVPCLELSEFVPKCVFLAVRICTLQVI